jgi:hypothetical protein
MHPQLKITGDPIGLDSDQIDLLAEIIVQMMCQVRPTTHLDPQFLVKLTLKPGPITLLTPLVPCLLLDPNAPLLFEQRGFPEDPCAGLAELAAVVAER